MVQTRSWPSGAEAMKVAEAEAEPKTPRKPGRTDDEELWMRLEERHANNGGGLDPSRIVALVYQELESDQVPLRKFLAADNTQTTGPGSLTNPVGYYRWLARGVVVTHKMRWRLDSTQQEQFQLALEGDPLQPEQPRIRPPALPVRPPDCTTCHCDRAGRVAGGGYCCCQMGRDLERAERRDRAACFPPAGGQHERVASRSAGRRLAVEQEAAEPAEARLLAAITGQAVE